MAMIEIISTESIKPSSPTPDHLRTFRLSWLDHFIPPMYFPFILYYSHYNNSSRVMQAEISPILKKSLSDALALYYPFAGRTKSESSVDCDDQGVDFLEAKIDTHLSEIIGSPNAEILNQFVPNTSEESGGVLLGIQLNYFTCGGIAIGISFHHKIADACTLGMFVKTWAAIARGDTNLPAPSFVASSLFPARELSGLPTALESSKHKTNTRRFCFSSSKIAALRAEVEASCSVVHPTRYELVTAAIWKWFLAQKGRDGCRLSVASHAVNLRGRMDPPLSDYAFGNLVHPAFALENGEMDLGGAVSKTREAIRKIDSKCLKEWQGENGYDIVARDVKSMAELLLDKKMDCVFFSNWCRFPFGESDFGWGKPVWVSTASCPGYNFVVLIDSKSDTGGIEVWITMDEELNVK